MKLAESWFHTCKVLLSRFHFISNGSAPFRLDWSNAKNAKFAKLDKLQVKFMLQMQALVTARGQFAPSTWLSIWAEDSFHDSCADIWHDYRRAFQRTEGQT
jgi:hypothetical protein